MIEPIVELKKIDKRFGEKQVFFQFSLALQAPGGHWLAGPSGSGKTTLLRLIAGLEEPDGGTIVRPPRCAFVFQENRLLPWCSVLENVAAVSPGQRAKAVQLLEELGLGAELQSLPEALSGGMRRRVALARALLFDAPLLLLDEPFQGLDAASRAQAAAVICRESAGSLLIAALHEPLERELLGLRQGTTLSCCG